MAQILDGKEVAAAIDERTRAQVAELKAQGIEPTLAILRVGEKADQLSYERGATKRCNGVDVAVVNEVLPENSTQGDVMAAIGKLNADPRVHGILMLAPLPDHIDTNEARNSIAPEKDVDCASDATLGGVFVETPGAYAPCTPQACIEMLDHYGIETQGKHAVVIGRSLVVGKPVSTLMLGRNATVTTCHSRTVDLPAVAREADILIAAIGRMNFVGPEFVSEGQTVLDVGINWDDKDNRLRGDVDFDAVEPIVGAISPVPGGIGSVTTSVLVSHVIDAAKRTLE